MTIDSTDFRVAASPHVDLVDVPKTVTALYNSRTSYKIQLKKHVKRLAALQQLHYVSD